MPLIDIKIQRELSYEYVHDGEADPETGFRNEEVTEELDHRDANETSGSVGRIPQSSSSALGVIASL